MKAYPVLQKLVTTILEGYPKRKADCMDLSEYWGIRERLSLVDEIIMYGCQIVIPHSMRREILKQLQVTDQGQE